MPKQPSPQPAVAAALPTPPVVYVAVEQTWDGTYSQPTASRQRALRWLVERIPAKDWASYRESLARSEDITDLPEDPRTGDPLTILAAYWGEVIVDTEERIEFGAGMDQVVYVERVQVLGDDD